MKNKIQFLVDNGLSVSAIARNSGVNATHLNKYLHGSANFSAEKEEKLRLWLREYKELVIANL